MKRLLATVSLALGVLGMAATPAFAGVDDCPSGSVCRWQYGNYDGKQATSQIDNPDYGCWSVTCGNQSRWDDGSTGLNNAVSSVSNHGTRCNIKFADGTNYTGADVFFGRAGTNYQWRDPYLSNGGGYETTVGGALRVNSFDNLTTSHNFCP
ncbi:peptidase inhibitor family I36 protein [Actinomycetota bacterium]|nr:peptidase inhibitor family I36 protein [Micrococcales bacterium]